jgi:hypothetical protein
MVNESQRDRILALLRDVVKGKDVECEKTVRANDIEWEKTVRANDIEWEKRLLKAKLYDYDNMSSEDDDDDDDDGDDIQAQKKSAMKEDLEGNVSQRSSDDGKNADKAVETGSVSAEEKTRLGHSLTQGKKSDTSAQAILDWIPAVPLGYGCYDYDDDSDSISSKTQDSAATEDCVPRIGSGETSRVSKNDLEKGSKCQLSPRGSDNGKKDDDDGDYVQHGQGGGDGDRVSHDQGGDGDYVQHGQDSGDDGQGSGDVQYDQSDDFDYAVQHGQGAQPRDNSGDGKQEEEEEEEEEDGGESSSSYSGSYDAVYSDDEKDGNVQKTVLIVPALSIAERVAHQGLVPTTRHVRTNIFTEGTRLARLEDDPAARAQGYTTITRASAEFINRITSIGEVIIRDHFKPIEDRVFKPKDVGGLAGGVKYVEDGLFFKFADPSDGPYGTSYEVANKAVGHELKGAIAVFHAAQAATTSDGVGGGGCTRASSPWYTTSASVCLSCPSSRSEKAL